MVGSAAGLVALAEVVQQLRVLQDLASSDNWVDDKVDRAPTDAESREPRFVHYLIR